MLNPIPKKRWIRLIPIAFFTYSLAYLDRANFGFAVAGGMAKDLNITSGMSSFLGALFFLGYFFFPDSGRIIRFNKKCKETDLLVSFTLGCFGNGNRRYQ